MREAISLHPYPKTATHEDWDRSPLCISPALNLFAFPDISSSRQGDSPPHSSGAMVQEEADGARDGDGPQESRPGPRTWVQKQGFQPQVPQCLANYQSRAYWTKVDSAV